MEHPTLQRLRAQACFPEVLAPFLQLRVVKGRAVNLVVPVSHPKSLLNPLGLCDNSLGVQQWRCQRS